MSTENIEELYKNALKDLAYLAVVYERLNVTAQAAAALPPSTTVVTTTTAPPSPGTTAISALSAPTPLLAYYESTNTEPVYGSYTEERAELKRMFFSDLRYEYLYSLSVLQYTDKFVDNQIYVVPVVVPKSQEMPFLRGFATWVGNKIQSRNPRKVLLLMIFNDTQSALVFAKLKYPSNIASFKFIAPIPAEQNRDVFNAVNKLLQQLMTSQPSAVPLVQEPEKRSILEQRPPVSVYPETSQRPVTMYVLPKYVQAGYEQSYYELLNNALFNFENLPYLHELKNKRDQVVPREGGQIFVFPVYIKSGAEGEKLLTATLNFIARRIQPERPRGVLLLLIVDDKQTMNAALTRSYPERVEPFFVILQQSEEKSNATERVRANSRLQELMAGKVQPSPSTTLSGAAASAARQ